MGSRTFSKLSRNVFTQLCISSKSLICGLESFSSQHYLLVDSIIESVKVLFRTQLQQTELFVVRAADLWLNKVKKFFDESVLRHVGDGSLRFQLVFVESASDRRAIH